MSEVFDEAAIRLVLEGTEDVKRQMEEVRNSVRMHAEAISQEAQASIQSASGAGPRQTLFGSLKESFGRGSDFGQFGQLLAGGGMVASLEVVGQKIKAAGDFASASALKFREGKASLAEIADSGARGIPIIGTLASSFESVKFALQDMIAASLKSHGHTKEFVESWESAATTLKRAEERAKKLDEAFAKLGSHRNLMKDLAETRQRQFNSDQQNEELDARKRFDETVAKAAANGTGMKEAKALAQKILDEDLRQIDEKYGRKAGDEARARDKPKEAAEAQAEAEAKRMEQQRLASIKSIADAQAEQLLRAEQGEAAVLAKRLEALGASKEETASILEKAAAVESLKKKEEERKEIARQAEEDQKKAEALVEKSLTPREKLLKDTKEILELRRKGKLTEEEAHRVAQQRIDETNAKLGRRTVSFEDAGSFASTLQAAISSGVTETKAMEKRRLDAAERNAAAAVDLKKLFAEWAAEQKRNPPITFSKS